MKRPYIPTIAYLNFHVVFSSRRSLKRKFSSELDDLSTSKPVSYQNAMPTGLSKLLRDVMLQNRAWSKHLLHLKQYLALRSVKMSVLTKKQLHGVVFDMDGTLTVPCLDFMKLRKQLCINKNIDILAHVDSLVGNEKANAMKTIEAFEEEGRKSLELQPGIQELFKFLLHETSLRPKLALVTRNNTLAVEHFLKKCATDNVCADAHKLFSIVS